MRRYRFRKKDYEDVLKWVRSQKHDIDEEKSPAPARYWV